MATFEDIVGASLAFGAEDIMGGDSLDSLFSGSGGGYPMVVGAQGGGDSARAALLQKLASKHAAALVNRTPTKSREFPLGFPTTPIGGGATVNVQTAPQIPFKGRRLIVPSDIAGSVLINNIAVGQSNQFAAQNPVPGRCFTELGVGVDLNLDTAQISQVITLNLTNSSGAQIVFNAAIIGTVVY